MSAGNNASAREAEPSPSSVTRPARSSRRNENPPRYTEPSAVMSHASSASAELRSAPPAPSRQRPAFQEQKASVTSITHGARVAHSPSRQCGRQIHEPYPEPVVHAELHLAGTRQEKEERVIQ